MLVNVGLDFNRARLEVRERFHLDDGDARRIYRELAENGKQEVVLLRTCNRVEIYGWWSPGRPGAGDPVTRIATAWAGRGGEAKNLLAVSTVRSRKQVARHLLRVASGLESQVLGDFHILGQLRRAYREAVDAEAVGTHLHRLFETALRVGKQVKRETELMAAHNSVGAEAARRAHTHWGELADRRCVVVGCGKSGTHAARALAELGAGTLTLVNRTLYRAEELAEELDGARALPLDDLPRALRSAHILIVATSAPEPIVRASGLAAARAPRSPERSDPLLVIDVSMPRNVEAAAAGIPGVELVDLDALHPDAAQVEKCRLSAVPEAQTIVDAGVEEFARWLRLGAARRALGPLRDVLFEICRREVSYVADESEAVERTADRIVAKVMAHPMSALRQASECGDSVEQMVGALEALFGAPGRSPGERPSTCEPPILA